MEVAGTSGLLELRGGLAAGGGEVAPGAEGRRGLVGGKTDRGL